MDDLRQRILDYCYYCNKSKSQFAKMFGMHPYTLKTYLNNPERNLRRIKQIEINGFLNAMGFWEQKLRKDEKI